MRPTVAAAFCCLLAAGGSGVYAAETSGTFDLTQDDAKGQLTASLDGVLLFTFQYGSDWELPHFFPLNTPSGKNLLVQKTNPYPHHRAFWVSDTVERDGVRGDVYNGYYSGEKTGDKAHKPPFNSGARHLRFDLTTGTAGQAAIEESLVWETQMTTSSYPLLDEQRSIKLHALGKGGYLMDFSFSLKATYGDVKFVSDAVHYSWPYLRINSQFSGENGGTITSDSGTTGQAATNLKPALWIDYSNVVGGEAEGVAMFQWPDGTGEPRKWLTREYGTFGPRRPENQSGKPFVVRKGESISQRVGVYVHRGDVTSGKVADIYRRFVGGEIR